MVLTGGLVVIQLKDDSSAARPGHMPRNTLSGAFAMLCSTVLSAYSGVYLEKLFKTVHLPLWLQSIQLSLFALPVAAVCMAWADYDALVGGGWLIGFNWVAWLAVALNALGGIVVSMTLKYADNIQKTFAVGVSIVLNCGVSAVFFDVPLTRRVIGGVTMVVGSTCAFNMWGDRPASQKPAYAVVPSDAESAAALDGQAAAPARTPRNGEAAARAEPRSPRTPTGPDADGVGLSFWDGLPDPSAVTSPSSDTRRAQGLGSSRGSFLA